MNRKWTESEPKVNRKQIESKSKTESQPKTRKPKGVSAVDWKVLLVYFFWAPSMNRYRKRTGKTPPNWEPKANRSINRAKKTVYLPGRRGSWRSPNTNVANGGGEPLWAMARAPWYSAKDTASKACLDITSGKSVSNWFYSSLYEHMKETSKIYRLGYIQQHPTWSEPVCSE